MVSNRLRSLVFVTITVTIFLFLSVPVLAAGETDYIYYKVQSGDYLWLIGWKFEVTVDAIKNVNTLTSDQIVPGQVLKVPKSTFFVRQIPTNVKYLVKPGDSLNLIGQKFGISLEKLRDTNKLNNYNVYPGQALTIPLPPQKRYTIQNGDTLFLVSQKFKASIETIKLVNKMNSSVLWIGQVLFVPDINSDNGTTEPPVGGQWGEMPSGVIHYHVKSGENLWVIAKRFNTTEFAIITTNHLATDLVQANQPLFIPQNSTKPVTIPYPTAAKKEGYGEFLDWEYASWILDTHATATLQDVITGRTFKVFRLGGSNHADVETLTAADTAVMKELYGGQWSWETRPVLVQIDGRTIAASMAGMPHDIETITDNNMQGHFDLHFLNSRTHNTNSIDPDHQKKVQIAAGN
jgi:LysM repeat protein